MPDFRQAWTMLALLLYTGSGVTPARAADHFFSTSDHVRLHYYESGNGPAILFLPGWLMPARLFEGVSRQLSSTNRVIALDPRSHGASDRPGRGHNPARMTRDIAELLNQLKITRVVVAGWSMGCAEGAAYLRVAGSKGVSGYVCIDGYVRLPREIASSAGQARYYERVQEHFEEIVDGELLPELFANAPPSSVLEAIRRDIFKTSPDAAEALIVNFLQVDAIAALQANPVAAMFMAAGNTKDQAELLKTNIPGARVEHFSKSKRALFIDEPEHFVKVMRTFAREGGRANWTGPPAGSAPRR